MASEMPIRESAGKPPAGLVQLQKAMFEFYSVLSNMAHMRDTAVQQPPETGWSDIDAGTLQARGKAPQSIEFLRLLPRLVESSDVYSNKGPIIAPGAALVAFEKGRSGEGWVDDTLPTPDHVIWLADAPSRDGKYLLLDTENVTITEWAPISGKSMLSFEEFEALPLTDRWMAYPTFRAHDWFLREQHRIETLFYIPVPSLTGGEPDFYYRPESFWEAEGESDADDLDPDYVDEVSHSGQSEDMSDGDGGSEGSGDGEDDDLAVSQDEVDDLVRAQDSLGSTSGHEVIGSSADAVGTAVQSNQAATAVQSSASQNSVGASRYIIDEAQERMITEYRGLCQMYIRNGWPSASFDSDKCRDELLRWAEEKRAAQAKQDEAEAEDRQRRTLEKFERRKKLIAERAAAAKAASLQQ